MSIINLKVEQIKKETNENTNESQMIGVSLLCVRKEVHGLNRRKRFEQ